MRIVILILSFAIVFIPLTSYNHIEATSCPRMEPGPACQEFWRADAIFIGVATQVAPIPSSTELMIAPYLKSRVTFSLEENFKGIEGTRTIIDLDDCGHNFQEGERYLVYAYREPNDNRLDVRAGSTRTRLVSEAKEDLEYIRGLSAEEAGSRIFGTVTRSTLDIRKSKYVSEPIQEIKVSLEGNNKQYDVLTDGEGAYQFSNLPTGTYRIRADISVNLPYVAPKSLKVTGHGCVPVNIWARRIEYISGKVLDAYGNPAKYVPISLVSADASVEEILSKDHGAWTYALTNEQGYYEFSQLAPGKYLLIINRTDSQQLPNGDEITVPRIFYPGVRDITQAKAIVINEREKVRSYDFRLPLQ